MTDEGIAEVYALAREAIAGGQKGFQFQAYPFRMTAENLAKAPARRQHAFWKNLKEGSGQFRGRPAGAEGRRLRRPLRLQHGRPDLRAAPIRHRAERRPQGQEDRRQVAELVAKARPQPSSSSRATGSGHESFRASLPTATSEQATIFAQPRRQLGDVSRIDALVAGPQEIALERAGRVAVAKGSPPRSSVASVAKDKAQPPVVASAPAARRVSWPAPIRTEVGSLCGACRRDAPAAPIQSGREALFNEADARRACSRPKSRPRRSRLGPAGTLRSGCRATAPPRERRPAAPAPEGEAPECRGGPDAWRARSTMPEGRSLASPALARPGGQDESPPNSRRSPGAAPVVPTRPDSCELRARAWNRIVYDPASREKIVLCRSPCRPVKRL